MGARRPPPGAFLAGLWDSYVITEAKGLSAGLQVNFSPLGFHRGVVGD